MLDVGGPSSVAAGAARFAGGAPPTALLSAAAHKLQQPSSFAAPDQQSLPDDVSVIGSVFGWARPRPKRQETMRAYLLRANLEQLLAGSNSTIGGGSVRGENEKLLGLQQEMGALQEEGLADVYATRVLSLPEVAGEDGDFLL